jgi:hypothetical protein
MRVIELVELRDKAEDVLDECVVGGASTDDLVRWEAEQDDVIRVAQENKATIRAERLRRRTEMMAAQCTEVMIAPKLNPMRAYNDTELRALLGGIGRTTLWEIRKRRRRDGTSLLKSTYLFPGGPRRTTATQVQGYIDYVSAPVKPSGKRKVA